MWNWYVFIWFIVLKDPAKHVLMFQQVKVEIWVKINLSYPTGCNTTLMDLVNAHAHIYVQQAHYVCSTIKKTLQASIIIDNVKTIFCLICVEPEQKWINRFAFCKRKIAVWFKEDCCVVLFHTQINYSIYKIATSLVTHKVHIQFMLQP